MIRHKTRGEDKFDAELFRYVVLDHNLNQYHPKFANWIQMPNSVKKYFIRANSKIQKMKNRVDRNPITFVQKSNSELSYADNDNQVTVILTLYKRGEYLKKQLATINNQTIKPKEIWLWCNDCGTELQDFSDLVDRVVISNFNWKYFGRFTLASMVDTSFTAIFDDDIFPGPKWFENCFRTINSGKDGILGGNGILLDKGWRQNRSETNYGWHRRQGGDQDVEVDFVGHAWFFRTNYIKYMWMEKPYTFENAEDIHFCAMAKKYGNVKTYVPRHSQDKKDEWSTNRDLGYAVGANKAASYTNIENFKQVRTSVIETHQENGWITVNNL